MVMDNAGGMRGIEKKKYISSEDKTQRFFVCSFFSIDLMWEIKEIDEAKMILQISGLSN